MLWLGLTLTTAALALLILGLRGRVIARGTFCRKCRFDLAGLDPAAACPECGRRGDHPRARRPNLRRASRPLTAIAIVLILAGGSLLALGIGQNAARIMALLPDRAVHTLSQLGVDAAFTELAANRVTRVPSLPDRIWRELIDDAVALQADPSKPWDPRYGNVLAGALIADRLTPDQIAAYFDTIMVSDVNLPEQIHHGSETLPLKVVNSNAGRGAARDPFWQFTIGTHEPFVRMSATRVEIPAVGIELPLQPGTGFTGLNIPVAGSGGSSGSMGARADIPPEAWTRIEPGTEITVTVAYEVEVRTIKGDASFFTRQATAEGIVKILDPEVQLIRLNAEPAEAFMNASLIRLRPLHVLPKDTRHTSKEGVTVARSTVTFAHCPLPVAGRVVLLHAGEEIEIGSWAYALHTGLFGSSSLSWTIPPGETPPEDLIASILEAGSVTIEIRPDPGIAAATVDVREILAVPLRFTDVPVVTEAPAFAPISEQPDAEDTTGRPVSGGGAG